MVQEYAVNCSEVTLARLWSHMDIFVVGHFWGWALKALLVRHYGICWTISVMWEVSEVWVCHIITPQSLYKRLFISFIYFFKEKESRQLWQ